MRSVLDEARREIDSVDKQLHNLLLKRIDLVSKIGKIKAKKKLPIVHPGREFALIKKLLAAHKGPFHEQSLFKIWREIIATSSLLQSKDIKVAITLDDADVSFSVSMMELTKNYFGSAIQIKRVSDPHAALGSVKEGETTFAVLPWPEDDSAIRPWWMSLVDESGLEHTPQVFGRLPFQDSPDSAGNIHLQAALISSVPFEESDDDRSLIALAVNDPLSRGGIVDKMQSAGFTINSLCVYDDDRMQKMVYLLDVDGFVLQADDRLTSLVDEFDDAEATFHCIGGYPVPAKWG